VPGRRGKSSGSPSARPELLPVPYFHLVFTLPAPIADIAYQNKAVIYDLLFKVSAETHADNRSRFLSIWAPGIGITTVLHTWGSATDPSPARAHDRARRGHLTGWQKSGSRAGPASFCRCACSHVCSAD